jgi:hypothetical protein
MPEFMLNTWFMVGMGVLLLGLIGVLLFLRNQRPD